MFNDDFYPSSEALIDEMLEPLVREFSGVTARGNAYSRRYLKVTSILDPQSGKGDIPQHLVKKFEVKKDAISCIEIDPELRLLTQAQGFKVIDSDFLAYDDDYYFDLIVMNPPFRNGAEHALKAWDVIAEGGTVVCVLNAETLRNPYDTKRRQLQALIAKHGRSKFVGQAFAQAERRTNVDCAIIWLEKPKTETATEFVAADFEHDQDEDADVEYRPNQLASRSMIKSLVAQYEGARRIMVEINKLEAQQRFYMDGIVQYKKEEIAVQPLNKKIDELKKRFWKHVFDKTNMGQITTSAFQKRFTELSESTASLAFSEANIRQVLAMFATNIDTIMQECLIKTFETATNFSRDENAIDIGWATNSSWRLNKKIIIPYGVKFNEYDSGRWSDNWYRSDFFTDLDKIMCWLSGRKYKGIIQIAESVRGRVDYLNGGAQADYSAWFETTFFKVRFFKKGTIHLIFKDADLHDRFNIAAAEGKNWIGTGH